MNTSGLIPEGQIEGEDTSETSELRAMLQEAKDYIASFPWAPPITEAYMGIGIGGVLGVWLLKFSEGLGEDGDEHLWVITGDLPSVYLVTDQAPCPLDALEVYCELVTDWAEAVKKNLNLDDVFPVQAPADCEHADMVIDRVKFIRERIIPEFLAE